jgi:glycosyltransferase involved in cell wall biosynthesis
VKIGYDAKWLFDGPPSGRVVVTNHARALVALNSGHDLYLFLDAHARSKALPFDHPGVHRVYVWGDNNLVANLWHLPREAERLELDACIYQNFVPPRAGRCARVAFIHSAAFESAPQHFSCVERLYFRPMKWLAQHADRVCTVSGTEKRRLARLQFAPPERIDVVPNGVDGQFRPRGEVSPAKLDVVRSRYGLPERFVLYVGRFNAGKNLETLLRAMTLLADARVPLVMAGAPNWKMFDMPALIERLGIASRVVLTGFVHHDELPALYALASVFAFVSYDESFGMPPLEAMAAGAPVVVSDRGALREVCGDAGTYADPDDPRAIARAIDLLLADAVLAERKRVIGFKQAGRFTWAASARALLESALLAGEARRRGLG